MRRVPVAASRFVAALAAIAGMAAVPATAQRSEARTDPMSSSPSVPAGRATGAGTSRNSVGFGPAAPYDTIRRVQSDAPAETALEGAPGAGSPGPGSLAPSPTPSSANLALPAAERPFSGGAPTFSALSTEITQLEENVEAAVTPLMRYLGLEESPWAIYGWIQNSFTANPSFPADGLNFGVNPNFKANQWMGNQYYMVIEDPLEREGEFNIGGRLDILFGNDWEFNHMRGVFDGAWPPGYFAGLDLAQFYAEMHLPVLTEGGLDVKFGRWYTLHGYEVVPAIGRPLLSVPYMFNYGQPFTHWGLMTIWNVNENLIIYNGAPQGWDQFQNANATWGYMGGFSWTGLEGKLNLTSIYSHNSHNFTKNIIQLNDAGVGNLATNSNFTSNSLDLWTTVLSYLWTDRLTQVLETDQGIENGVPVIAANGRKTLGTINASWYSFGNWFLYDIFGNDKLTGVWRSEVFWDPRGVRTGAGDRYYEQTIGLIYKPCEYLWVRPEARYDWAQFGTPYNDGVSGSQFTYGFDVILLY